MNKNYDLRVQALRIFACLLVIGCHVRYYPVQDGIVNKSALFAYNYFNDGVTIFFCITGFFLFNSDNFKKVLCKSIVHVLVPAILASLVLMGLSNIDFNTSMLVAFNQFHIDIKQFLLSLVTWNLSSLPWCFHLWYIADYMRIIIFFPILNSVCKESNEGKPLALYWALLLGTISLFLNDVQAIFKLESGSLSVPTTFTTVPAFLTLLGYYLYSKNNFFVNKWLWRIGALIIGFCINVVRYFAQLHLYSIDIGNNYYDYWSTGIACIFATCVIIFFLSFDYKKIGGGQIYYYKLDREKNILYISDSCRGVFCFFI